MKKTFLYFFLMLFIALEFSGCNSSSNETTDENLTTVGYYKKSYSGLGIGPQALHFVNIIIKDDERNRVFEDKNFDFEWGYTYKVRLQTYIVADDISANILEIVEKKFTPNDFNITLSVDNSLDSSTYLKDNKHTVTKVSENRYQLLNELNITINDSNVANELDDMSVSVTAKVKCYFKFVVENNKVKDIVMVKIERLE